MPQKGKITPTTKKCMNYLLSVKDSLYIYPIKMSFGPFYIMGFNGEKTFSSNIISKAVHELGWVAVPGYKGALNNPVGSYIYAHPENLIRYGIKSDATERTDNIH